MNSCRNEWFSEVVYLDGQLVNSMSNKSSNLFKLTNESIEIFQWQLKDDKFRITQDPLDEISYYIYLWNSCATLNKEFIFYESRSVYKRCYAVFESDEDFHAAMKMVTPNKPYTWLWKYDNDHPGYEVTSRGDRRYSPFFQRVLNPNGAENYITCEDYYKRYLKPYYNKGEKPPVSGHKFMNDYMMSHKGLMFELAIIGQSASFTDMFDKDGGQNKWYAEMLNQYYGFNGG